MVARLAAHVLVAHVPARMDHEAAPELPRGAEHAGLSGARAHRTHSIQGDERRQHLEPTAPESGRLVRPQLRIDEEWAVQLEFASERPGEVLAAVSDDHQLSTRRSDLLRVAAQLRNLFATEDSAEVANEGQNDRTTLPQAAESYRLPVPALELEGFE